MRIKAKASKKVKKIWEDGKECVWVEGYKGTENDLSCRGFQYEIGKEYTQEGKVSLRNNGFHFCKTLHDIFSYYTLNGSNRYFKVRALVYKEDWGSYGSNFAAKKIIFEHELGYEDLKKHITNEYPLVEDQEAWNKVKEIGYDEYGRIIFTQEMTKYGFGDTFCSIVYDNTYEPELPEMIRKAKAFYEEGISKDVACYLLLK